MSYNFIHGDVGQVLLLKPFNLCSRDAVCCRRAVPLAVALLDVSNPTVTVMDMLSRLSHDSDQEVAQNAIIALGKPYLHAQFVQAAAAKKPRQAPTIVETRLEGFLVKGITL